MKKNIQLKGLFLLCVSLGFVILNVTCFQQSKTGIILLIASVASLFIAAYYIGNNTNDKQFERMVKNVGGNNLFYIVDGPTDTAVPDKLSNTSVYY